MLLYATVVVIVVSHDVSDVFLVVVSVSFFFVRLPFRKLSPYLFSKISYEHNH